MDLEWKDWKGSYQFSGNHLHVDYLTLKFESLDEFERKKIARYFLELGFNSYQTSAKLSKSKKEQIFISLENKYEVLFVKEVSYWSGTILTFSGMNAFVFYSMIQKNRIHLEILSNGVLGRLDLCYSRMKQKEDLIPIQDFLKDCQKYALQKNLNWNFENNQKGLILRIGSRRSNNFLRIYETKNSLRFEFEMKGRFIQSYHTLLTTKQLSELEYQLTTHFLVSLGRLLPLNSVYLDWLVIRLRPIRKQIIPQWSFNSHYLQPKSLLSFEDRKRFMSFLQFLTYAQNLDFTLDSLGTTPYRLVVFRVQDFLKYQNKHCLPKNYYYQLKKLVQFFDELQENSLIKIYSESHYRSLVTIPEVNLRKSNQNCWIAQVWIAEELFDYAHPFLLPDFLTSGNKKEEIELQFYVLQVFSSIDVEKKFFIKEFFESYPSGLNNQRKTNMKKLLIRLLSILQQHDLIEPHYRIILNGNFYETKKLTTKNISEGFFVYEKISI